MTIKQIPGFNETGYYYDGQVRRLLLQFMAIFTNMQVEIGANETREASLIPVPIKHGRPDRVVAALKAGNTLNRNLRVPLMSAHVANIKMSPDLFTGLGVNIRETNVPLGGSIPDDVRVIHQRVAQVFTLTMELNIFTSNNDHQWQILEQICLIFDPSLQIQTSDGQFDRNKITTVNLTDIRLENNWPIGQDRKLDICTIQFEIPWYVAAPADIRNDVIKRIKVRIGMINDLSRSDYDIIAELDELGIEYEEIVDVTDADPV